MMRREPYGLSPWVISQEGCAPFLSRHWTVRPMGGLIWLLTSAAATATRAPDQYRDDFFLLPRLRSMRKTRP